MLRPRVFTEKLPFIPAHIYMRVALSLRAYKYARGAKRVKGLGPMINIVTTCAGTVCWGSRSRYWWTLQRFCRLTFAAWINTIQHDSLSGIQASLSMNMVCCLFQNLLVFVGKVRVCFISILVDPTR